MVTCAFDAVATVVRAYIPVDVASLPQIVIRCQNCDHACLGRRSSTAIGVVKFSCGHTESDAMWRRELYLPGRLIACNCLQTGVWTEYFTTTPFRLGSVHDFVFFLAFYTITSDLATGWTIGVRLPAWALHCSLFVTNALRRTRSPGRHMWIWLSVTSVPRLMCSAVLQRLLNGLMTPNLGTQSTFFGIFIYSQNISNSNVIEQEWRFSSDFYE